MFAYWRLRSPFFLLKAVSQPMHLHFSRMKSFWKVYEKSALSSTVTWEAWLDICDWSSNATLNALGKRFKVSCEFIQLDLLERVTDPLPRETRFSCFSFLFNRTTPRRSRKSKRRSLRDSIAPPFRARETSEGLMSVRGGSALNIYASEERKHDENSNTQSVRNVGVWMPSRWERRAWISTKLHEQVKGRIAGGRPRPTHYD